MQGTLFTPAEVCPHCKRDDGSHVAGCLRQPPRPPADVPIAPKKDAYSDRSPAQRERILELLQARGAEGASNADLNEVCFRFSARIFELRKMGHKIRTRPDGGGLFRFVLEA